MGRTTTHRCVALLAALVAGGITSAAMAAESPGGKTKVGPMVKIHRGEQCVEPTADMRRNHMNYILHQRDKTMHQGIRTTKHSLKNCVDCHADPKTASVLGSEGFCSSCHEFASVKMDCFTCHTDKRDPNAKPVPTRADVLRGKTP